MRIFIFERIRKVSDAYHEGGGLVVIAEDRAACATLIAAMPDIDVTAEEWDKVIEYGCDAAAPAIYAFPDAGCC